VPSHVGTLAPPGEYDWTCAASFGPPESTTQTANRSVEPFLHSTRQNVPILFNGRPFAQNCPFSWGSGPHLIHNSLSHSEITIQTTWRSVQPFSHMLLQGVPILYYGRPIPQNCSFPWGSEPTSNTWFLGPISAHNRNSVSISFFRLCTDGRRVSLYLTMGRPFPLKMPLPMGRSGPHSFLGQPKSSTQTASRSVQPFSQCWLVWQTDRQINRPRYSVSNNRAHLRRPYVVWAMRSNNV